MQLPNNYNHYIVSAVKGFADWIPISNISERHYIKMFFLKGDENPVPTKVSGKTPLNFNRARISQISPKVKLYIILSLKTLGSPIFS